MGDRYIVFGTDDGQPLYAVCHERAITAQPGDVVIITGKVKPKAAFTQAGTDEKGAQLLMQQPCYIEVEKIETARR